MTTRTIFQRCTVAFLLMFVMASSWAQSGLRMHVPFLPDIPGSWQTFFRLVGATNRTTIFTFRLFSSDGTPAGTYVYRIPQSSLGAARQFNGDYFKQQGAPRGPWSAFIDMVPAGVSTPAVYLRTTAGFVTPIHSTGEWLSRSEASIFSETLGASIIYGEYQWTLNPGRNRQQVGMLHVTTLGRAGEVFINNGFELSVVGNVVVITAENTGNIFMELSARPNAIVRNGSYTLGSRFFP